MSTQSALTEHAPMTLDATCSFAHKGRTERYPITATIRMDVRKIVRPDIIADARFMPFRDGIFDEICFDPPHLFRDGNLDFLNRYRRRTGRTSPGMFERYGYWKTRKDWLDFAKRSTDEALRTLKPKGIVRYKLTPTKDQRLKVEDIPLHLFTVTRHRITPSKSNLPSNSNVHWLTMKPKIMEEFVK